MNGWFRFALALVPFAAAVGVSVACWRTAQRRIVRRLTAAATICVCLTATVPSVVLASGAPMPVWVPLASALVALAFAAVMFVQAQRIYRREREKFSSIIDALGAAARARPERPGHEPGQ